MLGANHLTFDGGGMILVILREDTDTLSEEKMHAAKIK